MFQDFKELLSLFNAWKIRYLVVGGYAVSFHGQPRATKDLDILIKTDSKNAKSIHAALLEYGAPVQKVSPADIVEPGSFFTMGIPPIRVDILTAIDGVEFDACWRKKIKVKIGDSMVLVTIR